MTITLIIIAVLLFLIYKAIQGNSYRYDKTPVRPTYSNSYNRHIPIHSMEEEFKMQLTQEVEKIVGECLKISREYNHSNLELRSILMDVINYFRLRLKSNPHNMSSIYKISIEKTNKAIDEVCNGAIGTYCLNL